MYLYVNSQYYQGAVGVSSSPGACFRSDPTRTGNRCNTYIVHDGDGSEGLVPVHIAFDVEYESAYLDDFYKQNKPVQISVSFGGGDPLYMNEEILVINDIFQKRFTLDLTVPASCSLFIRESMPENDHKQALIMAIRLRPSVVGESVPLS